MMQPEYNLELWDSEKAEQNFDESLPLGSSTWNITKESPSCDHGEYIPDSPISSYSSFSPTQQYTEDLDPEFPLDFDVQASSTSPTISDFVEPSRPVSLQQPSSAQLLNSVYSKPLQENFASHNYDNITYLHPPSPVYLPHVSITPYAPVLNTPYPHQYMTLVPGYMNPMMGFPSVPSPPLSSPQSYSPPPCKLEVPPSPPIQTITTRKYQISSEPPPTEPLRSSQTEPLYQTSTPSQLKTPGNSDYYQPKYEQQQTLSESGGGNQATDTSTVKTQPIFPAPEIPQSVPPPKGTKRQAMTTSIDNRHTKRGVPHDRTPVENFLEQARGIDDYNITGLADFKKYVVIHEDNFFEWIMKKKDSKFKLKKTSFYEKFDKSRPANRVDSKQKVGPFQIKYLRVDKYKNTDYYEYVKHDMETIERKFGVPNMRVITHRDWNYLPLKFFVYEGKK
jgi:hypothetical protein